jgi:hypothetical protein
MAYLLERGRRAGPHSRDHFPAGFEEFFDELSDFGGVDKIPTEALEALCARYALEMDVDSVPELCKRFDVKFPGNPFDNRL